MNLIMDRLFKAYGGDRESWPIFPNLGAGVVNKLTLLLVVIVVSGCEYATDSSEDYDTNEIKVDIDIYMPFGSGGETIPNQTAAVTGEFEANYKDTGNPMIDAYISAILDPSETYTLRLTGSDKVTVNDGSVVKEMKPAKFKTYGAYFDTNYQGFAQYVLRFDRGNEQTLISSIEIPTFVSIVSPASGQSIFPTSEDIVVSWSGVDTKYKFKVSIIGDCVDPFVRDVGQGVYTFIIPVGTLRPSASNGTSCESQIILSTSTEADVTSAFREDSQIIAHLPNATIPVNISF